MMPDSRPNPWLRWDCSVCWVTFGLVVLVIASLAMLIAGGLRLWRRTKFV